MFRYCCAYGGQNPELLENDIFRVVLPLDALVQLKVVFGGYQMNEAETRAELIDAALKTAGWGVVPESRIRCEVITLGRLQGAGKCSKQDISDYVLTYRGQKLVVVEAKRRSLPETEGVAQAKRYAEKL